MSLHTNAQFYMRPTDELDKYKNGITYVIVKDSTSAAEKPYLEVFRKYWTFTKIKFCTREFAKSNRQSPNTFLAINKETYPTDLVDMLYYYLYLDFWAFKDGGGLMKFARIDLFTEIVLSTDSLEYANQYNYDDGSRIFNWGPGLLKNYLQLMQLYLTGKIEKKSDCNAYDHGNFDGMSAKEVKRMDTNYSIQISRMKNDTLYVPDYVLLKFTRHGFTKVSGSGVMDNYKYKYKFVSSDILNKMILDDSKDFCYLVYVKNSFNRYISVVNSKTGKLLYSSPQGASDNIKDSDIKDLNMAIDGH